MSRPTTAQALVEVGRRCAARGWVEATAGNFSAVLERDPLRVLVTSSGLHKGALEASDLLVVDAEGAAQEGTGRPSAEAALHLRAVGLGAGAVLHTHSPCGVVLSEVGVGAGGVEFAGYEMLKGLAGVRTHETSVWLPVLPNDQDYTRLGEALEEQGRAHPVAHAVLIHRHGLYVWGADVAEAERHLEVWEYLFEVWWRGRAAGVR